MASEPRGPVVPSSLKGHTLFVLQVFLPMETTAHLRGWLRGLMAESGERRTRAEERAFFQKAAGALLEQQKDFAYGVWDYVEDAESAAREYQGWTRGTVEDARSAAEERRALTRNAPPGRAAAQAGGYMFATFLFLLRKGRAADRIVCEECRMPTEHWFTRGTFGRLLHRIPGQLHYGTVRSSALYVRPGEDDVGISTDELAEPHYEYLKPLA